MGKYILTLLSLLLITSKTSAQFITTWKTSKPNDTITIPVSFTHFYNFNYTVDWGDGSRDSGLTGDARHTYDTSGIYTVSITGKFPSISFNSDKIMTIEQWGDIEWSLMLSAFEGCSNLTYNATDTPDLSSVISMVSMFEDASSFNGDISDWDVSYVQSMRKMFQGASSFNQDISDWDVSSVDDMRYMFWDASSFNQDLSNWDISKVEQMDEMLYGTNFSKQNYDKLLKGWSSLDSLQKGVELDVYVSYCKSEAGRDTLTQKYNWDIYDEGKSCSPASINLSEHIINANNANGYKIGMLSTYPENDNFTLVSGSGSDDNSLFTIVGDTLKADTVFDNKMPDSYSIRIQTGNDEGNNYESAFKIFKNRSPVDISITSATIQEKNIANRAIGKFITTDPDSGDTHTYHLVSGSGDEDNEYFTITDKFLKANKAFDYESKNTYSIRVKTQDRNDSTYEEMLTIYIKDGNEAPENITINDAFIKENNALNDTIGTFATYPPDSGEPHTYSLVSGPGDENNDDFYIIGDTLKAREVFDHESKNTYSIRAKTKDSWGSTYEKDLTIKIDNINEVPEGLTLSNDTLYKDETAGQTIGTLTTRDPDSSDVHTYQLMDKNKSFAIHHDTLKVDTLFDNATQQTHTLTVQTQDAGGKKFEKTFTITILSVLSSPDKVKPGITITPNPVTSHATIEYSRPLPDNLYLYNVHGKLIKQKTLTSPDQTRLNMSNLLKGVYYIRFEGVEEGYRIIKK